MCDEDENTCGLKCHTLPFAFYGSLGLLEVLINTFVQPEHTHRSVVSQVCGLTGLWSLLIII